MKHFKLVILCLFMGAFAASAQKGTTRGVIQTPGVQCDMCKGKIEKYLSRENGVATVKVDIKKKTTTVAYMPDRINLEQIKTDIANMGYTADDVIADEAAYKKLPACCKKPEADAGKH